MNYITDDIRQLIGFTSAVEESPDRVERGEIRRHFQAIMDPDPLYFDDQYAGATRFAGVVAPPLFPLHAVTRSAPDNLDPLEPMLEDPDFDGAPSNLLRSCVPLGLPLKRILNGGSEIEIVRYARPGDRIRAQSRYVDIYQKDGRNGPLVFWVVETVYTNQLNERLLVAKNTRILR